MRQYSLYELSKPGHLKDVVTKVLERGKATIAALSLLIVGALIAGCGSGGGSGDSAGASSQVVSGVAATGSPLVGTVTLRDSSTVRNDKVSDIAVDGSFAIDVAGMTAPFILKATGTADGVSRTMFSFADKPGIANINPLSSIALANAAGVDDPAEVFDKSDPAMLDKVKSGMSGSVATLQLKLKPLLDEFSAGSTDPVKDPFKADHEGLDAVFDNVKVVIANGILTITNVDTGVVLFTARVKDLDGRFNDKDEDMPKHGRPRPAAPTGVTAVGGPGAGQVTVSWDPVANATSYDLFYTSKSKVADEEDRDDVDAKQRIKNVTSPSIVSGLDQNTTYFFVVRARIDGRKGPRSAEVSASPSGTTTSSTTTTTTGATTSTTAGGTTTTTAGGSSSTTAPTTSTTTATTPTTTTTTSTTTTTTLAGLNGAALYAANCQNCHNPLAASEKRGTSAGAISTAIANNTGGMGFIVLTPAQIAAIALALQ